MFWNRFDSLRHLITGFIIILPVLLSGQSDSARVLMAEDTARIQLVLNDFDESMLDTISDNQDVHPQDSPEERGFLIVTADGKAKLRFRGSIRLNGVYDFNGLQTTSTFSTYDIPVGAASGVEPRYNTSIEQTRMGLEASRDLSFTTQIEACLRSGRQVSDWINMVHF